MARFRRRSSDVSARNAGRPRGRPHVVGTAGRPQVEVRPGLNVWRLLRSDTDDATKTDITHETGSVVRYFLGLSWSPGHDQSLVPSGHRPEEWRFDDVRPLQLIEINRAAGPAMPAGELLADRTSSVPDTIPSVSGKKPWWVLVRFWWRGPAKTVDYPGFVQGALWQEWGLNSAKWVLDRAVWVPREQAPADPGAETWGLAVAEKASAAVDDFGAELKNWVVLGLFLAYALSKNK